MKLCEETIKGLIHGGFGNRIMSIIDTSMDIFVRFNVWSLECSTLAKKPAPQDPLKDITSEGRIAGFN